MDMHLISEVSACDDKGDSAQGTPRNFQGVYA